MSDLVLHPVGYVESTLRRLEDAPMQSDEEAPPARLVIHADTSGALRGLEVGMEVEVLTWLGRARRDVLEVHPRGDGSRGLVGVFATRSADRPNPVGLHRVRITDVAAGSLGVDHLEALSGTAVLDVKPVLGAVPSR